MGSLGKEREPLPTTYMVVLKACHKHIFWHEKTVEMYTASTNFVSLIAKICIQKKIQLTFWTRSSCPLSPLNAEIGASAGHREEAVE